ncbi:GNAT family N-acetyltransferase [Robbsia andropogonis]|uniref:GNAT family N-acetyltransferase n=1 Tax=Robbsia andropogonis TaxID=28092 RepID=UPI000463483C|nr:GNAT family N-acetyltransferase [Robbsia andropogonis]
MNSTNVRKYQPGDLDGVARLFNDYRIFYGHNSDIGLAVRFISDRIANTESVIFVADADSGPLVGLCQLYPTFCSVAAAPIYILYDLFVAPNARRAGLAKQLLLAAIEQASTDGKARVDLTTAKQNFGAQALYESLGWKRDEIFYTYSLSIQ